jgi:ligand-binding sensor domain-containing protein/DNA-binding CsgD family transcriptional regulator
MATTSKLHQLFTKKKKNRFSLLNGLFLLSLLFIISPQLIGQGYRPGSPFITHYPKQAYQGGTQNWTIIQDEKDIVFVGNNHGMLEYDGQSWKCYELPNETLARSLTRSQDGKIYIGGQGEWGYFHPDEQGKWKYHSLLPMVPAEARNFTDVWTLLPQSGGIWAVSNQQIMFWDGQQVHVIKAEPNSRFEKAFAVEKKAYLHDWKKGLMVIQEDRSLSPLPGGDFLKETTLAQLFPTGNDSLLVVTAQKGLFLYHKGKFEAWQCPANDFLLQHQAYCAERLSSGNYAFGSPQNGLLIADARGNITWHINAQRGLANNTILSMLEDSKGHLWLGLDNGLSYVEINSPFSLIGPNEGVSGTGYASCIHNNTLYLGTNQGVFKHSWPNQEGMQFQQVRNLPGQVWGLRALGDSLWVGHHEGPFVLHGGRIQRMSQEGGAWKFLPLQKHPDFALGGMYNGLIRYQKMKGRWQAQEAIPGFQESCRVMEEGPEGHIWVTHFYRGLFRLTLGPELQRIEAVKRFGKQDGLPSDLSVNVHKIAGKLVFVSEQGIFQFDKEKESFIPHAFLDSLFEDDPARWLWEGPQGDIWFATQSSFGYLQVKKEGLRYTWEKVLLNRLHSLLVEGFEQVFAYDEQHVLIATESGFIHYNPSFSANKPFPAPLQLAIREVYDPLGDSLLFGGNLFPTSDTNMSRKFPSQLHSLIFSFAAPQFSEQQRAQYRYRLKGFEERWSGWSEKASKEYTNLSHGKYEFLVQARTDLGVQSGIAHFRFKIATPWYLTPLAKGAWAILILLGLGAVFWANRKRVQERAENLLLAERRAMQKKEAAYQLTIEENQAEILKLKNDKLETEIEYKKQELASTTMHLLQKSETLSKLQSELSKIAKKLPDEQKKDMKEIIKTIEMDVKLDKNWQNFEHHFDQVHEDFIKRLRESYPQLTPKDLKLAAYLRMNLVTKEIAPLLNISVRGVEISRYRLRKKLDLDREDNLVEFMMNF